MTDRRTVFSDDRRYRYTLWREWDNGDLYTPNQIKRQFEYVQFIGLNPSTADETKDDPTIRRCIDFAKRWGYGALCMTNLFGWRSPNPYAMMAEANPVGMDNHHWILQIASRSNLIVAAWGNHGTHQNQDLNVREWLASINAKLHCLRLTKGGEPEHPLYLPATLKPQLFK